MMLWSVRQPWCTPNLPPMRGRRRGPFRVPYPTGNNGIAQFYQFLVSELSFSVGFCEGHCPYFCKLCSLLVYMIYLSHLFFSLKNHTNHFFFICLFSFSFSFLCLLSLLKDTASMSFSELFLSVLFLTSIITFLNQSVGWVGIFS